jgi:hypothetical protein
MSFTFRPARREKTPLIIGLAGPTKSGKTLSAHRVAAGLAAGGPVAMINAEGAKGHQYAERFDYLACDIERPFSPARYTEVLRAALEIDPAVVIIDSASHMHDGPGGLLEYHDAELDRLAGENQRDRDKKNWTAWIKPKAAENDFIYTMLEADCHLILCFRAKEKLKIVTGQAPIDLGWQPIAGDRIAFETIFTLMLPPHSKGIPDLSISQMREPFDALIPKDQPLSEETGALLASWALGAGEAAPRSGSPKADEQPDGSSFTPPASALTPTTSMTMADFKAAREAAGISAQQATAKAGALFPGRTFADLTEEDWGHLWAELQREKERAAA